jgi:hypothetical protein
VARSSELRAVRVTIEAHTDSPSLPGGFAPIMTVLKLKNAVGVMLMATPSQLECYLSADLRHSTRNTPSSARPVLPRVTWFKCALCRVHINYY